MRPHPLTALCLALLLSLTACGKRGPEAGDDAGAGGGEDPTPTMTGPCLSQYLSEADRAAIARVDGVSSLVLEASRITAAVAERIGPDRAEEMIRNGLIGEWVANPFLNCLNQKGVSP